MGNQRYLSPTVPMNPSDLSVGDGPDWKVHPRCTANHIETQPEHTKTLPKQPLSPPFLYRNPMDGRGQRWTSRGAEYAILR